MNYGLLKKRVSITIKSVGLNCTFTTVIENIYKGERFSKFLSLVITI